jgi:hypothetical protein
MFKGYRTYLAIGATALVVLGSYFGIIPAGVEATIVSLLTAAGLYYRSQANQ